MGPPRSLEDLKKISSNPAETAKAIDKLNGVILTTGHKVGDPELRETIARLYDNTNVHITAEDVIISPGTTGANALIFYGLLKPGDHVVCSYPAYEALPEIPKGLGAEMSYWRLNPDNEWQGSLDDLKSLLRPETKMIILNNPHNPTGAVLSTSDQEKIVKLASEHNIIVFTDEIFRPLFHSGKVPASIVEHENYERTIASGSLSKVWGFAGVRIGWVVTRNEEIRENIIKARMWNVQSVSVMDEIIAKEILSERCCQNVIDVTLANARENIKALEAFVKEHEKAVWSFIPRGASTAFVKFMNPKTGGPVDDVALCKKLRDDNGLLLSPGGLTFGTAKEGDLRGFVRVHMTPDPKKFKNGLQRIGEFIVTTKMEGLSVANGV